jgi:hypothetical protein
MSTPFGMTREESKRFFFEKKKQKTFVGLAMGRETRRAKEFKSFLLLFSKKEGLPSLPTPPKQG